MNITLFKPILSPSGLFEHAVLLIRDLLSDSLDQLTHARKLHGAGFPAAESRAEIALAKRGELRRCVREIFAEPIDIAAGAFVGAALNAGRCARLLKAREYFSQLRRVALRKPAAGKPRQQSQGNQRDHAVEEASGFKVEL